MRLSLQLHTWRLVLMEGATNPIVFIGFQMVVVQDHREGEQFFDFAYFHWKTIFASK